MGNGKYQPKIGFYSRRKRREKILGRVMIYFIVGFLAYYFFCHQETMGHDTWYVFSAFLVLSIGGIILLGLSMREAIEFDIRTTKKILDKILIAGTNLIMITASSMIMSFITGYVIWDQGNKAVAKGNTMEEFYCDIEKFRGRKNKKVDFKFQNKSESFTVSRETCWQYSDKNPSNYQLHIIARKGMLNYYLVESREIATGGK